MKGFRLTLEGIVEPSWIDANRHMNVMWYLGLFDRGGEALLQELGINAESVAAGRPTVVGSRILIAHRRELLLGESWQVWSGLTAVTPEYLTFTHRMTCDAAIRATCDIRATAFCPVKRARTVLGADVVDRARSLIVPGLVDRFAHAGPGSA